MKTKTCKQMLGCELQGRTIRVAGIFAVAGWANGDDENERL